MEYGIRLIISQFFRRGITATNINFDYNGKKEFVIDAACFPGSSGFPVFIWKVVIHI